MKKGLVFMAVLLASTTLMAETMNGVKYIDADGVEQTADSVNIVTNAASIVTWGQAGQTTWYVVTGTNVQLAQGAICNGDVHLILVDRAKLTATGALDAGIRVSGEGNSLTIYAQSTNERTMGTLIATSGDYGAGIGGGGGGSGSYITINGGLVSANGKENGAGIGGGWGGSGSNITINGGAVKAYGKENGAGIGGGNNGSGSNIIINGGRVTATGGNRAAGIGGGWGSSGSDITINGGSVTVNGGDNGAGIGGGKGGSGSNITINGGTVTANGGEQASGIGGGNNGSGSNIFICVTCRLRSDGFIHHDGTDIAALLAGKVYVSVYTDVYLEERNAAYAAINALTEGIADEHIQTAAATFIEDIFQEDKAADINAAKEKAMADLQKFIAIYNSGKAAGDSIGYARGKEEGITEGIAQGKAEALGSMAAPCENCTAVEVKKGDKVVTLYAPDQVTYKKEE